MRNTEISFEEKEEDDNDYKKDEEDKKNKNKNEDESGFLPFHGKILGNVWFFFQLHSSASETYMGQRKIKCFGFLQLSTTFFFLCQKLKWLL